VRARHGFTLFEVMAAVIVLGVIYSLLASTAVQGLRAEGTSRRRLEASLLVDQYLSDIEAVIAVGATPEMGSMEEEVGDFLIAVDVTPFDLVPYLGEEATESEPVGDSLFSLPASGDQSFLRTVEVVVSWLEGLDEYSVRRTTFAYDIAAAAPYFAAEVQEGGGELEGGEDGSGQDEDGRTGTPDSGENPIRRGGSRGGSDAAIEQMLQQLRNAK